VFNLKGLHFHARMTLLARYAQYLFNLQHNTARTGMQQRMRLTTYMEHTTATSRDLERLRHENAVLHSDVAGDYIGAASSTPGMTIVDEQLATSMLTLQLVIR
jgi:hypothetical protein